MADTEVPVSQKSTSPASGATGTGGGGGSRGGGGGGRGKNGSRPNSRPTSRADNHTRRESASGTSGGKKHNNSNNNNSDRRASQDAGRGQHGRRQSAQRGGSGANNAGGGRGARERKTSDAGSTAGEDRLRQVIGELKNMPTPSGSTADASPEPPAHQRLGAPPSTNPGSSGGPRKNTKEGTGMKSTLNPNAGGFQPGALSSISDVDAEVLITPAPDRTQFPIGADSQAMSAAGFPGGFITHEMAEEIGFSGNPNRYQFPTPGFVGGFTGNPAAVGLGDLQATVQAQALQVAQMQAALAAAQQQNANLPPRFAAAANAMNLGGGLSAGLGGMPGLNFGLAGATAGIGGLGIDNILSPTSESLQIQQQLEILRQQQEALMSRFGDLQSSVNNNNNNGGNNAAGEQRPGSAQSSVPHRRGQSVQIGAGAGGIGGSMGSFSLGNNGAGTGPPKGHGRRHSVQVGVKSSTSGTQGFQFPAGSGATGTATVSAAPMTFNSLGGAPQGELELFSGGGQAERGPPPAGARGHRRGQSSISGIGGFAMDFGGSQGQVDLNQAQMQLQQLAQFRAASGHARVPSFGFQNPMNLGPGQNGFGQGNQQQMRKSLFAPYLPQASIPPLLSAGKLVIGTLRVNKRNRSDAYVATDSLDSDIYICGSKDRNRALEGDVVAVELLDVDEVWGTKKEKEEKKRKKEENQAFDPRAQQNARREDKKRDDVEVEGQGLILFEEEEVNDDQRPSFAGHIVAVVERMPGQLFSGTLGLLRPSSAATKEKQEAERREREGVDLRGGQQKEEQKPKIVWHRPTDKRVPLIAIPVDQAPPDFLADPNKYASTLFIAGIKRWPITSLHPFGTLVEELGPIGDIEVESNALLKDCNFSSEEFSENVARCLPPTPWQIPDREYEVRRDFRGQRVFTIDPENAKDLDDALHVSSNNDGTFEVGVHIADVTYFVKPNTALDREARKRATTVYLVQRAVPMLPPSLSEELCSLTPGADKLTFSVVFKLTPDGRVVDTWFGKSIIHSVAKLAYPEAQAVIKGGELPAAKLCKEGVTSPEVEEDIRQLNQLARHLQQRRYDDGCLRMDKVKLGFTLDEDGLPDDCKVHQTMEANELVQEFMLLANVAVGQKVALGLPEQALLRRHEAPIDRRLEVFVKRARKLGFEIDTSSAGALMRSFDLLETEGRAPHFAMQLLATKSMLKAKYFCAGTLDIGQWQHYALNVPIYTHFTSPIRRFADILVHRQLEAVLPSAIDFKFTMDLEAVTKVAQQCNIKREAARLAQEQSQHLFLCVLIAELTRKYGPVVRRATVINVLDEAFDVAVSDFGIEKRIHVDQMPIDNHVHDEHANTLKLYWKKGVDVVAYLSEHSSDAHLISVRQYAERHAKLMEASSGSVQAESALFDDDDEDDVVHPRQRNGPGSASVETATEKERKSVQRMKSLAKEELHFEGVEAIDAGPGVKHHVQTVKELQDVPVIITADTSKSPPIIKVFAVNPFA